MKSNSIEQKWNKVQLNKNEIRSNWTKNEIKFYILTKLPNNLIKFGIKILINKKTIINQSIFGHWRKYLPDLLITKVL